MRMFKHKLRNVPKIPCGALPIPRAVFRISAPEFSRARIYSQPTNHHHHSKYLTLFKVSAVMRVTRRACVADERHALHNVLDVGLDVSGYPQVCA